MAPLTSNDFTYTFQSSYPSHFVFNKLLDVRSWWSGLYSETIDGDTDVLGQEFTFRAGGGAHYSKQKLVELIPNKKIVWQVMDSTLRFLTSNKEWSGTKICFDIIEHPHTTNVHFTHIGLVPNIECYGSCSHAWTQYLQQLALALSAP